MQCLLTLSCGLQNFLAVSINIFELWSARYIQCFFISSSILSHHRKSFILLNEVFPLCHTSTTFSANCLSWSYCSSVRVLIIQLFLICWFLIVLVIWKNRWSFYAYWAFRFIFHRLWCLWMHYLLPLGLLVCIMEHSLLYFGSEIEFWRAAVYSCFWCLIWFTALFVFMRICYITCFRSRLVPSHSWS